MAEIFRNCIEIVAPLAGSVDRNADDGTKDKLGEDVAPLAGSVDRNMPDRVVELYSRVAPLAGSVDRNNLDHIQVFEATVAPLAGSVDRNPVVPLKNGQDGKVAPLAGSVDRNCTSRPAGRLVSCRSPRGERG